MLICPNCKSELIKVNKTYKCINNHSFDISKEGYINLLINKSKAGDNQNMIKARIAFLDKGYFDLLLNNILSEIELLNLKDPKIIDLGCADGYYTNSISKKYPNIIGFDISKDAIKLASKHYKDGLFIVASVKELPLSNGSVDIILNIFAPHFIDEYMRVLNDNGYLIKVTPNKNHLLELKEALYDQVYLTKEKPLEDSCIKIYKTKDISYKVNIPNADIQNLLLMTPYFYTTSTEDINKLNKIKNLFTTLDFNITIYKKTF